MAKSTGVAVNPKLVRVEVLKYLAISVVKATMRFIRDNQVEETNVERFIYLHHRRIARQENSVLRISSGIASYVCARQ